MREKFVKNFAFLLLANFVVKPLWIFGVDRSIQVSAGAIEYGHYFTATNFSFLFSVILDLGINNFTNRAVSRNAKRAGEYMYNLLRLKMLLAFIYIVVTLFFALLTGVRGWLLLLVLGSAVNMLLLSFILHFRAYVAALHIFKVDAFISVLDKLLAIILMFSVLFLLPKFSSRTTIAFLVGAQTIALLSTTIFAFLFLKQRIHLQTAQWNLKFYRLMILKSLPFALLVLQMTIYGRIDGILLNTLLPEGSDETGVYASGFRLLDAATQFGFLVATLLLPLFSKAIKQRVSVAPLVKLGTLLVLVASISLALFTFYFRIDITNIMYHTFDERYSNVLSILMFAFIPLASIYVYGTLLTANGNLKQLNQIAILGIVTNLVCNFWLIPREGAIGAAKSALITQVVVAIAHLVVCYRVFSQHTDLVDNKA